MSHMVDHAAHNLMRPLPEELHTAALLVHTLLAFDQSVNNLTGVKGFYLDATARIWP
jgi:hypothetical protein